MAARCVLAALGQPAEVAETPEEQAEARLVGGRIIAKGLLGIAEFLKGIAEASKE